MIRVQCAFADTHEVERVVEFISKQPGYPEPYLLPEFNGDDTAPLTTTDSLGFADLDEMFEDAARLIVQTKNSSPIILQRRLKVGYNRAARLMDQLESTGVISPIFGKNEREVLISNETELNHFLEDLKKR